MSKTKVSFEAWAIKDNRGVIAENPLDLYEVELGDLEGSEKMVRVRVTVEVIE